MVSGHDDTTGIRKASCALLRPSCPSYIWPLAVFSEMYLSTLGKFLVPDDMMAQTTLLWREMLSTEAGV